MTISLFAGTPAYAAPEQLTGSPTALAPAVDVWALGVLLYESLAGCRPFQACSLPELTRAALSADPAPLCVRGRDVAGRIEAVCARCLAKDPARRPSAGEVAAALGC
jgi:serine/threonine-protein kinase